MAVRVGEPIPYDIYFPYAIVMKQSTVEVQNASQPDEKQDVNYAGVTRKINFVLFLNNNSQKRKHYESGFSKHPEDFSQVIPIHPTPSNYA